MSFTFWLHHGEEGRREKTHQPVGPPWIINQGRGEDYQDFRTDLGYIVLKKMKLGNNIGNWDGNCGV